MIMAGTHLFRRRERAIAYGYSIRPKEAFGPCSDPTRLLGVRVLQSLLRFRQCFLLPTIAVISVPASQSSY